MKTEYMQQRVPFRTIFLSSLLVAGNLIGLGILALPIKMGLSGFLPSLFDILLICTIMLISAFVIAIRLAPDKKNFDIPSFFHQELGTIGRWLAIICNLILLYGVLVAYLSVIASMLLLLLPIKISHIWVTIAYFFIVTSLIMFGRDILKRGNAILLASIFICFLILVQSSTADFNPHLLTYVNWKFLPLGLPVAVFAFHFHNIIPTIANYVNHDTKATCKAIIIGVIIGLVMNLIWTLIVLGSLLPKAGVDSILDTFVHGLPATIPLTHLLHSGVFTTTALIFPLLTVSAAYVANGTGLFGFIKDMTYTYLKTENNLLIGCLAFIPPLVIAIIYPQIFLSAIDIVGGVGETILFIVLPGIILTRMAYKKSSILSFIGYLMVGIGLFIFLFLLSQKIGLVHLAPV